MHDKRADALLGAAIKCIEEIEALVVMLENVNSDPGPAKLTSKLREIANLFDRLPLLENDLRTIKRRLRGMLSSDPEVTPKAVSLRDFPAVTPDAETKYEPVEDRERRIHTRPGLGPSVKPPLPKKTPP